MARAKALAPRLEHVEQVELFSWARANEVRYPELVLLFAIPNGARTSMRTAVKLKLEGLKSGVPDVCLAVARGGYHGLYIELKREKGGTVGPAQRLWQDALRGAGYAAVICRGARAAQVVLERYLTLATEDRPELTHEDRDHHAA